jgi:RNA polymerase sigma-70 factor (ECF subfamily)
MVLYKAPMSDPFVTTQWSLVLLARDRASAEADHALANLCRSYWYPLYAYIRRQVPTVEQAEDLTQAFFARILEKDFLHNLDRTRGKFRSFLLAACKHFLANERDRARAAKRGGGCTIRPVDFQAAAERYRRELVNNTTPEKHFERTWAMTLLNQALEQLEQEYTQGGQSQLFMHLRSTLAGGPEQLSLSAIGTIVGMTEPAAKKAAQRLRGRYRATLRTLIAATVQGPGDLDEEVQALFAALSG